MLIFDTAPLHALHWNLCIAADAQFSAVWEICPIISSSGRLVHILWLSKERWISPISLKWDSAKALRSCYCLNWVSWAHPSFPKSYALIKHWKNYRKMTQEIQKVSPSYYGWFLLWDPTKKGQWALHVYSIANFVASRLRWLQMIF